MSDTAARTHLIIGTPCFGGQVTSLYAASLLKLQEACAQHANLTFSVLMPGGDALIPRVRQTIVAHFLETPTATHLLFIDADIGFEPAQVFRLLDFDADMAAGIYPIKRIDWQKTAALAVSNAQKGAGTERLEPASLSYVFEVDDPRRVGIRNGFAQVKFAGTGFLMIKRAVLEAMIARYPELRYTREHNTHDVLAGSPWRSALFNCLIDEKTGVYLSEDYSFCRRWTDMGGQIWADLQSKLTHVGPVAFAGDVSTQFGKAPG